MFYCQVLQRRLKSFTGIFVWYEKCLRKNPVNERDKSREIFKALENLAIDLHLAVKIKFTSNFFLKKVVLFK